MSLLLVVGILATFKGWAGRREGLVWVVLCLAGGAAILWPESTSTIAQALGIGRGADLLLYCAILVMMAGFWATYIRLRRLRHDMTRVVRHLSLLEAERDLAREHRRME